MKAAKERRLSSKTKKKSRVEDLQYSLPTMHTEQPQFGQSQSRQPSFTEALHESFKFTSSSSLAQIAPAPEPKRKKSRAKRKAEEEEEMVTVKVPIYGGGGSVMTEYNGRLISVEVPAKAKAGTMVKVPIPELYRRNSTASTIGF